MCMDMKIYEYYLLFRKNMEMKMSGFECETLVLFYFKVKCEYCFSIWMFNVNMQMENFNFNVYVKS